MQTVLALAGPLGARFESTKGSRSQIGTFCVPPPSSRSMTSRIRIRPQACLATEHEAAGLLIITAYWIHGSGI